MLENNVNKKQIAFQTMQPNQAQQQQVPMEAMHPELLQENIQDSYIANRVTNTTDDPEGMRKTAAIMVPTWFALTQAMDVFNKHSRGEFENTLQYKVGQFGDRVANSSVMKSGFMQSIGNGLNRIGGWVKRNILEKSRLTSAMIHTPSIPTNSMALANYIGMPAMQLFDYPQQGESFVKLLKYVEDLDCYGATKEEIAAAKTSLSNATTQQARNLAMQEAEYNILIKHSRDAAQAKRLAANWATADAAGKAKILRDMKAFEWGYKDFATMEKYAKETHKYIPEILDACLNANKNVFARNWGTNHGKFGKLFKTIIGREISPTETANKLAVEFGNVDFSKPEYAEIKNVLVKHGIWDKLPKSAFAKGLNKYLHLITEGATNRVAGGKAVALMQAWFLAEAIYKASKAEGFGEKAKTFAERFTELVALFACIPFALKLMHGIGGMQYAGMTKEQVALYRKHLDEHNLKAMKGEFASKKAWKASYDALKDELNAGVKNPFVKLGKRIGRIVSVGLEQIRPYDKTSIGEYVNGAFKYREGWGQKFRDLFRHPKFGLKQIAGYPMRIGLGMMIIMPFLSKLAVKGSHLVFGKPKHSLLDEEKEKEQAEKLAQMHAKTQIPQQLQQNPQPAIAPVQYDVGGKSQTNLINQYRNGQPVQNSSQTDTQAVAPKPNEPVRTYIPSSKGFVSTKQEDLTAAEAAMKRADIAEQQALQTLKMGG